MQVYRNSDVAPGQEWTGDLSKYLHLHDFLFLVVKQAIDFGHRIVRHLLHFFGIHPAVVLAHLAVLLSLLEAIHAVAPHVTGGDLGLLGIFMSDLDQRLAPLFVEFR